MFKIIIGREMGTIVGLSRWIIIGKNYLYNFLEIVCIEWYWRIVG